MSCGVVRRPSLHPGLLWPWCRLAAETLIQPLAWETSLGTSICCGCGPRKCTHAHKKNEISVWKGKAWGDVAAVCMCVCVCCGLHQSSQHHHGVSPSTPLHVRKSVVLTKSLQMVQMMS